MNTLKHDFIRFVVTRQILKFGQFTTKAGRASPYFFNAGLFHDGESLRKLAHFYAQTILNNTIEFDMLFGPAYKGIVLASSCAISLAEYGHNTFYAYNRKEPKDHGEGGKIVGYPLKGKILIIDDVITAGTSVRESIEIIKRAGAQPAGIVVALDRMERGITECSAIGEIEQQYNIKTISIITLDDILTYLSDSTKLKQNYIAVNEYRKEYGVIN